MHGKSPVDSMESLIDTMLIYDMTEAAKDSEGKYAKYHKDITHLESLDVYRVLDLFEVTDHAIGHAVKKLLMSGQRTGEKSVQEDIEEAVDALLRKLSMSEEDEECPVNTTTVDGATLRQTQTLMPEQVLVPCQTHAPATPDLYMCLSCGQTSTSLQ